MGGIVSGVVGGLLGGSGGIGGLLGGALNSVTGGLVNKLADSFGLNTVFQGITNLAGDFLKTGLGGLIDNLPMPAFLKDSAKDLVEGVIGGFQKSIAPEAQHAVNRDLGSSIENYIDDIISSVSDETTREGKRTGAGSGPASGHWLMALASAMGKVNGEQLGDMIAIQDKMTANVENGKGLEGEAKQDNAAEFAKLNAEFQAASKIFSMTSETISTSLKSISEGLTSLARKQ